MPHSRCQGDAYSWQEVYYVDAGACVPLTRVREAMLLLLLLLLPPRGRLACASVAAAAAAAGQETRAQLMHGGDGGVDAVG